MTHDEEEELLTSLDHIAVALDRIAGKLDLIQLAVARDEELRDEWSVVGALRDIESTLAMAKAEP